MKGKRLKGLFLSLTLLFLTAGELWGRPTSSLAAKKHQSQLEQNTAADKLGFVRYQDGRQLKTAIDSGELVPLPATLGVRVDDRVCDETTVGSGCKKGKKVFPLEFHFCRPATAKWLIELGDSFYLEFKQPLVVNSAVRTVERQRSIWHDGNRSTAASAGPRASSHLTGATIDIAKLPLSSRQREWLRERLREDVKAGRIIAIEERSQAVFHVMVLE